VRILVTGSRNWTDEQAIVRALALLGAERDRATTVIVHGDCPTGADAIVKRLAEEVGIPHEPHPADWKKHGTAAGPIRNQEMVNLGADVCLAFFLGDSRGTRDCRRRALRAGIKVVSYYQTLAVA